MVGDVCGHVVALEDRLGWLRTKQVVGSEYKDSKTQAGARKCVVRCL